MINPTQGGRSTSDNTPDATAQAEAEVARLEAERAAAQLAEERAAAAAQAPEPPARPAEKAPELTPEEIVAAGVVVPAATHDADAIWVDEETFGAPPEGCKSMRETAEDAAAAFAALDTTTKED